MGLSGACSLSSVVVSRESLPPSEVRLATLELPAAAINTRRLFRVQYDGPEGSGSMRMVMRLERAARFQMTASDLFGRTLWSLDASEEGLLLIHHRRRVYCRTQDGLHLPEVALSPLPVDALPSVFLGYLPAAPGAATWDLDGGIDFVDRGGHRWTARTQGGILAAWTLWSEDSPLLWWTRQKAGGILSHRLGRQFRWREVAKEALDGDLERLRIPDGLSQEPCADAGGSRPEVDQNSTRSGWSKSKPLGTAAVHRKGQ